ncbi:MAG: response regulator [Verrucomicrobiota bacterium]
MSRITVEPIRVLLVEDDEADIILTQRALEKANIWNTVDVVRNGQEALDYLRNEHAYTDRTKFPRPGLVLLDLNLPGLDGREVLDIMCKDPKLKTVPVVIVSTSDYEKDVEYGRARGVQHYIIKPLQIDNMMATFTTLPSFRIILGNIAS